jgi:TonB-linked SusC/RagA family outer membrane protein
MITGVVSDQHGSLIGVNVIVKGTKIGVITDVNGQFSIEAGSKDIITFSYIGYNTLDILVGEKTILKVTLEESTKTLDEVVVVGYGTMKKSDLTGAISSLKGEDIQKSGAASLQEALQGRVSGVQVNTTDGAPGGGMKILIRGGNSIMNDNEPLYVIDGMQIVPKKNDPSSNPLSSINPRDIESMEILKDASATAIYGADGANGVIIVTTKKGKLGKPVFNGYFKQGFSTMATNGVEFINPNEYALFQTDFQYIYGMTLLYPDKSLRMTFDNNGNPISDASVFPNILYYGLNDEIAVDWLKEISRVGTNRDAGLSISGGKDGTLYNISTGIYNEKGVIKASSFDRFNFMMNLTQDVNKKLKISGRLGVTYTKQEGLIDDFNQYSVLNRVGYTSPFVRFMKYPQLYDLPYEGVIEVISSNYFWQADHMNYINSVVNQNAGLSANGKFDINYNIIKNLSAYFNISGNYAYNDIDKFYPNHTDVRQGADRGGYASSQERHDLSLNWYGQLNYNNTFAKKHKLNATAIFEGKYADSENKLMEATNFQYQEMKYFEFNAATRQSVVLNSYGENSSVAGMARVNYNYDDRYLFTSTIRADASSRFSGANRWGFFPSASAAWYVSKEKFFEPLTSFVSNLKLRVGYGAAGNNRVSDYAYRNLLIINRYIYDSSVNIGIGPDQLSNPNLKWETTHEKNFGIDYGFFNGRLSGSVELYDKLTTDVILEVQVPRSSGFTRKYENVGKLSNKGIEVNIQSVNIDTKNLKWTTNLALSRNRSKVLDLGEKSEYYFSSNYDSNVIDDVVLRVGEPIGTFYGLVSNGVYNTTKDLYNNTRNAISGIVGKMQTVDINGDGVVNDADRVVIGRSEPAFTGGLNNSFTYKSWDLAAFIRFSYGNDLLNGNLVNAASYWGSNNIMRSVYQQNWSPYNPESNYHSYNRSGVDSYLTSSYIEDGSFVRLDNVTFGYTLPKKISQRFKLGSFRAYCTARNLFLITRYSWFDPEVNTGWGTLSRVAPGIDAGSYPKSRKIEFGIDLTF